jgi:FAD/FMN-containing dehydrogenase
MDRIDVESLRARLDGNVIARDDPHYESTRCEMLWNRLLPDAFPELIVRVRSEADVATAVRAARQLGLGVAVRGRGHQWGGSALRNGTLLIDLAALDALSIDPAARTASLQPGVTGRAFCRALAPHGLAFPIGHCGSVPLSGYLLSGGLGWNMGAWGPACASVEAVEMVTADGACITANDRSHADLLWAARGAGPWFFAVATRFHVRVQPLPGAVVSSTYVYPLDCTDAVAQFAAPLAPSLARFVELRLFLCAPPQSSQFACILTAVAFADSAAAAAAALQVLEGCPVRDRCIMASTRQPTPFDSLVDNVDAMFPERHRYLADALWLNASAADVLPTLRERIAQAPSAKSAILCALTPVPPGLPDMAFSISARTFVGCYATWDDPRNDARNRAWHNATTAPLQAQAVGRYVGEGDIAGDRSHAANAFSAASWARLRELRRRYDPDGLFGASD